MESEERTCSEFSVMSQRHKAAPESSMQHTLKDYVKLTLSIKLLCGGETPVMAVQLRCPSPTNPSSPTSSASRLHNIYLSNYLSTHACVNQLIDTVYIYIYNFFLYFSTYWNKKLNKLGIVSATTSTSSSNLLPPSYERKFCLKEKLIKQTS